jgi:hypothetical protein
VASTHIARQGDCLSSIAAQYGFPDWRTIYHHAANTQLRTRRPDPNVLYPADEVYIPDRVLRRESCVTDEEYIFVAGIAPTYLNVCVQDPAGSPFSDVPYKLLVDRVEFSGTTDEHGWIRSEIPARAAWGTLIVCPNPSAPDAVVSWRVLLGHLDPLDTTSGVKGRLNNLGFGCGTPDDRKDEALDSALRRFQQGNNLTVDGIAGPLTQAKLKQAHGL